MDGKFDAVLASERELRSGVRKVGCGYWHIEMLNFTSLISPLSCQYQINHDRNGFREGAID